MKYLFLFLTFVISLNLNAQSKKVQIQALDKRVDSLKIVLSNTRYYASEESKALNREIYNYKSDIIRFKQDSLKLAAEVERLKSKIEDFKTEASRLKNEKQNILVKERKNLLKSYFKEKVINIDSTFYYKESQDFIESLNYLVKLNQIRDNFCEYYVDIPNFEIGKNVTLISRGWLLEDGTEDESCGSETGFLFHDIAGSPNKLVSVQTQYSGGSGADYMFKAYYYLNNENSFFEINFDKPYDCYNHRLEDTGRYKMWFHQFINNILTIKIGCCQDVSGCASCCPDTELYLKYKINGREAVFIGSYIK